MRCLTRSTTWLIPALCCAAACAPVITEPPLESDSESDSPESSTTDAPDSSTTDAPLDESTTGEPPGETDTEDADTSEGSTSTGEPPPPPLDCGDGADDLAELWRVEDPERERGESVSVADGRVVWVASAFAPGSRVRAHDLAGAEQWSVDVDTFPGEGGLRQQAVATGPLLTVLASTDSSFSGNLVAFDGAGQLLFEHTMLASTEDAGGVAIGSDGAILFGGSDQDLQLRLFDDEGLELGADDYDHGGDEHVFDLAADPAGGYVLAGHSNAQGRPLVARVSAGGSIEWVAEASAGVSETAHGVSPDGAGGAWLAVAGQSSSGRLDHFDADGDFLGAVALDHAAQQVEVDAAGNLLVLGRRFPDAPIVVQRLAVDGTVLAEATYEGYWGLDLATDGACDVYITGSDANGAYLVKLD